jgi:hypothetical protein
MKLFVAQVIGWLRHEFHSLINDPPNHSRAASVPLPPI